MAQPKHFKRQPDAKMPAKDLRESSEVRRCRNTLSISGRAILVFLAWRFVKSAMLSTFGQRNPQDFDAASFEDMFANLSYPLVGKLDLKLVLAIFIIVMIYSFIELFLCIYVSRCALAQSRGEDRSGLYLLVACVVLTIDVTASLMVMPLVLSISSIEDILVSTIIDLTSFAMLFDLIRAGTKLRRLTGEGT